MTSQLLIRTVLYLVTVIVIVQSQVTGPTLFYYTYETASKDDESIEMVTDNEGNIYFKELVDHTNSKNAEFNKEKFQKYVDTNLKEYSEESKKKIRDALKNAGKYQTEDKKEKGTQTEIHQDSPESKELLGNEDKENKEPGKNQNDKQTQTKDEEDSPTEEEDDKDKTREESSGSSLESGDEKKTQKETENDRITNPKNKPNDRKQSKIIIDTNSQDEDVDLYPSATSSEVDGPEEGIYTREGEYTYHALIYTARKKENICSGGIITDSFIITSATCVYQQKTRSLVVTTGTGNNLNSYAVYNIYYYDKNNISFHDIALLKTNQTMNLETIVHLELRSVDPPVGVEVTVTGFKCGSLRYEITKIINQETCKRTYPFIKDESVCGVLPYYRKGRKCFEESGSPVVWKKYILGVVSLSKNGQPSRYINIYYYFDWLFISIVRSSVSNIE